MRFRGGLLLVFAMILPLSGVRALPALSGSLDAAASVAEAASDTTNKDGNINSGFEVLLRMNIMEEFGGAFSYHAGVNLGAASGTSAAFYVYRETDENYAARIELDKLFLRYAYKKPIDNSETGGKGLVWELSAGLLPIHLGMSGGFFAPSDYLIKTSPVAPDLPPRNVLGALFYVHPQDWLRVNVFTAYPSVISGTNFEGHHFGAAADFLLPNFQAEVLAAFQGADALHKRGLYMAGLSARLDWVVDFFADAFYMFDPLKEGNAIDGLSISAGFDTALGAFSFSAEYLFSGKDGSTADILSNRHYIKAALDFAPDAKRTIGISGLFCIGEELSTLAALNVSRILYENFILTFKAELPLDAAFFSDNARRGEFGQAALKKRYSVSLGLSMAFGN